MTTAGQARLPAPSHSAGARIAGWVPALGWLRTYEASWLRGDVIAGFTLAAYLLPSTIGNASLANLPPQAGLYACLFSGLVFWLFCSSRYTAVTITSSISLLVGSSLGGLANGDTARFGALAAGVAILVGAIALVAWALRAGSLVNFISESVMVGFKTGVACQLASSQLPKFFGFPGGHGDFWQRMAWFARHVGETNPAALTVGLAALAVLVLGKVFLKSYPVALAVVIAGIAVTPLLGLQARGVNLLGEVPQGLPHVGFPAIHLSDVNEMLPLALACFMLGAVETAAIGRTFAAKRGGRFVANQEFLALAMANFAAALGRGLPVSGGTSESLVNEGAGARSPVSNFLAAIVVLLVTLFLSGLLRNLPQPVLAAIVLVAVVGLFKVSELRHLWRAHRAEFAVAAVALVGVLTSGVLRGVMIGAIISLLFLLRRAAHPHVAFLGRIPGTRRYSDLARHADNEPVPSILIFRPESSLLYFNADHVCSAVLDRIRAEPIPPRLVLADLSDCPILDLQAAEMLGGLASELATSGIRLQVVETHSSVRDILRTEGLDEKLGGINRFTSVADAVEAFQLPA